MRPIIGTCLAVVIVVGLAGCAAPARVEFTTPRVLMHVEGKVSQVETVYGQAKVERLDEDMYRVHGTGEVRINDFHLVEVASDKIRVHGVDVESKGALRNVYVEKEKVIDGVHPDRVDK